MRIHSKELPRRGGRTLLLPTTLLLQVRTRQTSWVHPPDAMAWVPFQYYWYRRQRFLLRKFEHNCQRFRTE